MVTFTQCSCTENCIDVFAFLWSVLNSFLLFVAGGDSLVPGPRSSAPVQLCYTGGPVERRLHLRRDVQEKVRSSKQSLQIEVCFVLGSASENCILDIIL